MEDATESNENANTAVQGENWVNSLPEPLREAPFLAKAESPEAARDHIIHAAQHMGRSVVFPSENATAEEKSKFYSKVLDSLPDIVQLPSDPSDEEAMKAFRSRFGVPESSKDYVPEDVENWEWDAEYVDSLRGMAHAAGLNLSQFQALTRQMAESGLREEEALSGELEEARAALKNEWGGEFEARMKLLTNWASNSEAPEAIQDMVASGNVNPGAAKWLYNVAKQFTSSDKPLTNDDTEISQGMTPGEATDRIQQILSDPAYRDVSDPRHKFLRDEMLKAQRAKLAGSENA